MDAWNPLTSEDLQGVLDDIGALAPSRVRAFEVSGELDTAYRSRTCRDSASMSSDSAVTFRLHFVSSLASFPTSKVFNFLPG